MGIVFFLLFDTGAKPRLLKREHKTTIDNDDVKNFLGRIPCKSRSHGALEENG